MQSGCKTYSFAGPVQSIPICTACRSNSPTLALQSHCNRPRNPLVTGRRQVVLSFHGRIACVHPFSLFKMGCSYPIPYPPILAGCDIQWGCPPPPELFYPLSHHSTPIPASLFALIHSRVLHITPRFLSYSILDSHFDFQ